MCNREAPGIEQFARQHAADIKVIGIGTQDSLDDAKAFLKRHDVRSFPLLWEDGFESWNHFGVQSQPIAILLTRDGDVVDQWRGALGDEETAEILAAASKL